MTRRYMGKTQSLESWISMALRSLTTIGGFLAWEEILMLQLSFNMKLSNSLLFAVLNSSALITAMKSCSSCLFSWFWNRNRRNTSERGYHGSMWVNWQVMGLCLKPKELFQAYPTGSPQAAYSPWRFNVQPLDFHSADAPLIAPAAIAASLGESGVMLRPARDHGCEWEWGGIMPMGCSFKQGFHLCSAMTVMGGGTSSITGGGWE